MLFAFIPMRTGELAGGVRYAQRLCRGRHVRIESLRGGVLFDWQLRVQGPGQCRPLRVAAQVCPRGDVLTFSVHRCVLQYCHLRVHHRRDDRDLCCPEHILL
jgi:hypothetical protein